MKLFGKVLVPKSEMEKLYRDLERANDQLRHEELANLRLREELKRLTSDLDAEQQDHARTYDLLSKIERMIQEF